MLLLKVLKDSAILTAFIFIFNVVIKLIFNPDNIIGAFEKEIWMGLGVYLTSLVTLFVIVFLILFISRYIFKPKNS